MSTTCPPSPEKIVRDTLFERTELTVTEAAQRLQIIAQQFRLLKV